MNHYNEKYKTFLSKQLNNLRVINWSSSHITVGPKISLHLSVHCEVPENIHTPTTEGIGNSSGMGGSMAQEIPEGRRGEWLDKFPEGQLDVHVRHKCSKL